MSQIPHSISLDEAIDLTSRFRANRPSFMPICETFDRPSVLSLLNVTGAAKLRVYMGEKSNGNVCTVLVAANDEGADILPTDENAIPSTIMEDDALILDDAVRCPELCPPYSPLNG
jgi:hypothetical protein